MFRCRSQNPFIYLDNAATTQKPQSVLEAIHRFYKLSNANVHRSPHSIGMEATALFEQAREKVSRFINASPDEVIFTKGTTESINLVAGILSEQYLNPGDVILLTPAEHHSNLIPWQMVAKRKNVSLKFINLNSEGRFDLEDVEIHWDPRIKVFAFQHASNVLGTIHNVKDLCHIARSHGALTVVDGAQAAPHLKLDVKSLGCDFYTFSGHKICGPTGIGILYGRKNLLEAFDPIWGGGEMILKVSLTEATYNQIPYKFEPGTPNIAGAVGLGAAIDYLESIGMDNISLYIEDLAKAAYELLKSVPGLTIFGPPNQRTGALSFWIEDIHPHDIASLLDHEGIAVRAGHHCAQPLMNFFGVPATTRASFYFYNTIEEAVLLVNALKQTQKVLGCVS
ncbi:MAG: aminotransferase class V-fold PLP-dependent enzyme [bacterium]